MYLLYPFFFFPYLKSYWEIGRRTINSVLIGNILERKFVKMVEIPEKLQT